MSPPAREPSSLFTAAVSADAEYLDAFNAQSCGRESTIDLKNIGFDSKMDRKVFIYTDLISRKIWFNEEANVNVFCLL